MSRAEFNPYAAPQTNLTPQIVCQSDIWHDGKQLFVRRETQFPDRCVKCNAPADGYRLRRTLYWHNPLLFLLILIAVLLYFIVAIIVRKNMRVEFGLCAAHRQARNRALIVGWVVALAGIGAVVFGVTRMGGMQGDAQMGAIAMIAGLVVFLAGTIYGITKRQTLTPNRIDDRFAWLKGAGYEFLVTLPSVDER